jgi:hypothetical protein
MCPPAYFSIVGLDYEEGAMDAMDASNMKSPRYQWAFCRFLWEAHLEFAN